MARVGAVRDVVARVGDFFAGTLPAGAFLAGAFLAGALFGA
ncbi:unannotated protein [freshwater metagenome]|uniref:Unannotated protein n=1 Tax=freshwater metagenome TaxID=449393 RepID=A0A6J7JE43_9ZZZZ